MQYDHAPLVVEPTIYLEAGAYRLVRSLKGAETPKTLLVGESTGVEQLLDLLEGFVPTSNVTELRLTGKLGWSLLRRNLGEAEATNYFGTRVVVTTSEHPSPVRPYLLTFPPRLRARYPELSDLVPRNLRTLRYPPASKVFRALEVVAPKVLILGQDPYHQPGQANGLAFSCTASKRPPSLANIFRELGLPATTTGDLQGWVDQGVMLLNTSLTVLPSTPGSDLKAWAPFIELLMLRLAFGSEEEPPIKVVLAWGKPALETARSVFGTRRAIQIITTTHPSPLSAHTPATWGPAFLGSGCFTRVNEILLEAKEKAIDWSCTE